MGMPMNEEPSLMTIDEVAEYLQLHPPIVRRLARDRKIPVFKLGWQWRTKRELLDRWIEQQSLRNAGVEPNDQTLA